MKRLLLPFALLFTTILFSQSKADSLQVELKKAKTDTSKVKLLHLLFQEYQYDSLNKARQTIMKSIKIAEQSENTYLQGVSYSYLADFLLSQSSYDSAITAYNKSLELSQEIQSDAYQLLAFIGLGSSYLRKGDFENALHYKQESIQFAQQIGDKASMAKSYKGMGDMHHTLAEYTKAMESYTEASKLYLELNSPKEFSITLANIGMVQWKLENFESAKTYFLRSDSIFKELDFQPGRAAVLQNLGVVYKNQGKLELAIKYYPDALKSYQQMGDRHNIALVHYNTGNIFWEKDDLREAVNYYQKALDIFIATGDSVQMAFAYKAIGDAHNELKESNSAEVYLLKAIAIANTIDLDILAMQANASLSELYKEKGDYVKAFESISKYTTLKDSLYTKEKRELANEIEAKYQNEQQTKEIALLESERTLKELQLGRRVNERNWIIAFSLILLTLAGLLYNQFRIKKRANKELRELDRIKSNFFANISHEFRTPLTLIKGPIEELEQSPDEGLPLESIKMIRRNTNRVLQLVNQLLDLSKIDEGNLQLEQTEGDVYKCFRGAASSFNSHAAQRNIDYKVQIPHEVYWANFDRDKLEKIAYNLLGNAFKFIEDGGVISLSVVCEKDELKMVVSDTGMGIGEEKLPFIFDRFYQVHDGDAREHEGSGIGLSLSKELAELMDGTITVSSEVGKGTIFTLVIPMQKIKTGAQHDEKTADTTKANYGDRGKRESYMLESGDTRDLPSVVLVEDNPDMSYFIKEHLQNSYRVKAARDGINGLKLAKKEGADLIITDVMMPKMDGVALCKALKSDLETSHIPVIMLTAKAGLENKIVGLQTGADDYLTKPFEPKELLARVENLIAQRRNLRALFTKKGASIDPKKITVTSLDEQFLQQALELLEKEFSNPDFGVPQMQEALALSKAQLHRKLKALTNEAPGELLRNFRLKRAAQLLLQKSDTVTQIAYAVGFNNLSYFAKCFKERYGVTPSSY